MARTFLLFVALALAPHTLTAFAQAADPLTEKYTRVYLRAEAALQDFDQELENAPKQNAPGFQHRSPAYRELLALRQLQEEIVHELAARSAPLAAKPADPVARLALADLQSQLIDHGRAAAAGRPLFSSPSAERGYAQRHQTTLQQRIQASRHDQALKAEIDAMLAVLGFDRDSETPPPTAPTEPSPGPNGNLTGNTFPQNTWVLTYDDGPSPKNTLPILDILTQYGKKASFFWLAQLTTPENAEIIAKVKAAGMALNNHSFTHYNLPKANSATLEKEIVASTQVQEGMYGEKPKFFRCPYGAGVNENRVRQLIADQGMIHVFWNVDSLDWKDKRPASILKRVKRLMELEKKGVILFHDIHTQTVAATRLLMEYSKSLDGKPNQHRWVTLPEIVAEMNAGKP